MEGISYKTIGSGANGLSMYSKTNMSYHCTWTNINLYLEYMNQYYLPPFVHKFIIIAVDAIICLEFLMKCSRTS